jgi:hypothetical protein
VHGHTDVLAEVRRAGREAHRQSAGRKWPARDGSFTASTTLRGRKSMEVESYKAEKEAIRKAILDYYHEDHVKSDPELYEQILHPE